jgi:hypothetical protein
MNTTYYTYFKESINSINSISVVYTPKPQCKGNGIKWFDDSKLIKKQNRRTKYE